MISMADHSQSSTERQLILSISLTVFWVNKRQRFAHQKPLIHLVGGASCKYMLWAEYSTNIAGQKVNGKANRNIRTIFCSVHEQWRRRPSRALETTSWISRFFIFFLVNRKVTNPALCFPLWKKKHTFELFLVLMVIYRCNLLSLLMLSDMGVA